MNGQPCLAQDCQGIPAGDDLFCPVHWKALARWARTELVRLRNGARRGNKRVATDYAKAALVAAKMVSGGPAESGGQSGP